MRFRVSLAVLGVCLAIGIVGAQGTYRVDRIVDGDTIVVAGIGTVRLIGVDTPETVDPRKPVEAFSAEASAFLTGLLAGQVVRVEYDQTLKDKYQRTLAYLYLPDGRMVNREIVRLGYGHAYTEFPFKYLEDFRAAEREARAANRGLWAQAAAPVGLVSSPAAAPGTADQVVYATRTGEKYHRDGCRSLSRSKIPMSLKEAAAKYSPCTICKPPTLAASTTSSAPSSPAPKSNGIRTPFSSTARAINQPAVRSDHKGRNAMLENRAGRKRVLLAARRLT